jgi:tRNA/tmRNA/rRNA uracil-C5-methylase (TrmA/RlmC/RlmD family)
LGAAAPAFVTSARSRFRRRARLAVRGRMTTPKIGIFELGTHRVVDIPNCLVHHPLVNDVAAALKRAVVTTRTPPYSDEAHQGFLRYAQIAVERRTETAQVVLVTNSETSAGTEPLCAALSALLGERLHSLHWNGNPGPTNAILGPHWKNISGPDAGAIEERVGGARVFYPPGAFGQSNFDLAEQIVEKLHAHVPDGARVLELYAGVGPIGLGLVERSAHVRFNEAATESLAGLDLGVRALAAELGARTEIVPGRAAAAAKWIRHSDVVIADPPRKGLDPEVREALLAAPPSKFFYVSCGLPSFLDDMEALCRRGPFGLVDLVVYDLFPHTEHVEIFARLDPKG